MMEAVGSEEMARRLDRLERSSRHWKYTGIACMAVAIGSMAITLVSSVRWTTGPKLVEAQGFVLKDLKGERLAILGIRTNGYPLLTFYGKNDKANLMIGYNDDGHSALDILGPDKSRTTIFANSDGEGGLSVFDSAGTYRAAFGMWKNQSVGMNVFDRIGRNNARASLGVKPDGTPILLLRDSSGEPLFEEPSATKERGARKGTSQKGEQKGT